ncbi:hypothetical protein OUZ56_018239 [Daphnia magna]|uniref:Uncharacterized protein n=1 Tax=Daphnia magna TaxID=35525 RepID=A0ABQ9Z8E6_9CRUS|nr:hypothetical protein OUZ56_018239 [Daphnia magna]
MGIATTVAIMATGRKNAVFRNKMNPCRITSRPTPPSMRKRSQWRFCPTRSHRSERRSRGPIQHVYRLKLTQTVPPNTCPINVHYSPISNPSSRDYDG